MSGAPAEQSADSARLVAADLRDRGIDSPFATSDADLERAVEQVIDLGHQLDDLIDVDLAGVAARYRIRSPGTIEPKEIYGAQTEFGKRLRLALGLAPAEEDFRLTPEEREAGEFFRDLAAVIGEDEVVALLRVIGASATRVARAVISVLRVRLETLEGRWNDDGSADGDVMRLSDGIESIVRLIDTLLEPFLAANSTMLRHHLADVASDEGEWRVDDAGRAALEDRVIGFADLVGFTAFTEQASAQEFLVAIQGFEEDVYAAVLDNGGSVIKLIGDEVMFTAPDAISALNIALELSALGRRSGDLEGMRVGLASGQVLSTGGDYFGTVVNIAARIVNLAFTHAIVVTAAVAQDLAGVVQLESLGNHDLRGISRPVELLRLRP